MRNQGSYKDFNEDEKTLLKEVINKNINPSTAVKLFLGKLNKKYSYTTIRNKAIQYNSMYWDTKSKKYIKGKDPNNLDGQLKYDFLNNRIIEVNASEETLNNTTAVTKDDKNNLSSSKQSNHTSRNHDANLNQILNYLETLNKNICSLNSRLNKIENYIQKNSPQKKKESTQNFIDIYSSNRKRESVNINSDLKSKIIKKMEKDKEIFGNQSLAINTALLIALYNEED